MVLVSAGIGATPTLAMLHSLAATPAAAEREVWWLYGAPNREGHPFALEAQGLLRTLKRSHIVYSRPSAGEQPGKDFDATGHLAIPAFETLGVSKHADFYLCGPQRFLDDLRAGLAAWGVAQPGAGSWCARDPPYAPEPLELPAEGQILICCSQPQGDLVLDLRSVASAAPGSACRRFGSFARRVRRRLMGTLTACVPASYF